MVALSTSPKFLSGCSSNAFLLYAFFILQCCSSARRYAVVGLVFCSLILSCCTLDAENFVIAGLRQNSIALATRAIALRRLVCAHSNVSMRSVGICTCTRARSSAPDEGGCEKSNRTMPIYIYKNCDEVERPEKFCLRLQDFSRHGCNQI